MNPEAQDVRATSGPQAQPRALPLATGYRLLRHDIEMTTAPQKLRIAPSRDAVGIGCDALVRRVLDDFRWKHRIQSADEIEIADTPGYWQIKAGCPGGENCRHASRIAGICCDGTTPLTIYFAEHGVRDIRGRFVKPHRAWQAWRVNPPNNRSQTHPTEPDKTL